MSIAFDDPRDLLGRRIRAEIAPTLAAAAGCGEGPLDVTITNHMGDWAFGGNCCGFFSAKLGDGRTFVGIVNLANESIDWLPAHKAREFGNTTVNAWLESPADPQPNAAPLGKPEAYGVIKSSAAEQRRQLQAYAYAGAARCVAQGGKTVHAVGNLRREHAQLMREKRRSTIERVLGIMDGSMPASDGRIDTAGQEADDDALGERDMKISSGSIDARTLSHADLARIDRSADWGTHMMMMGGGHDYAQLGHDEMQLQMQQAARYETWMQLMQQKPADEPASAPDIALNPQAVDILVLPPMSKLDDAVFRRELVKHMQAQGQAMAYPHVVAWNGPNGMSAVYRQLSVDRDGRISADYTDDDSKRPCELEHIRGRLLQSIVDSMPENLEHSFWKPGGASFEGYTVGPAWDVKHADAPGNEARTVNLVKDAGDLMCNGLGWDGAPMRIVYEDEAIPAGHRIVSSGEIKGRNAVIVTAAGPEPVAPAATPPKIAARLEEQARRDNPPTLKPAIAGLDIGST